MTTTSPEAPRDDLLKSMKRTKGVRFNASKRLEKSEKTKTAVIAYASASVIVLTILPAFFVLPTFITGMLALATVGMSVVILAATLIQNSDAGMVKSDQFHRCALEVNALRRSLLTSDPTDATEVARCASQYNEIMQRYGLNHDPVDYEQYQREHPDEFPEAAGQKGVPENSSDRATETASKVIVAITGVAVAASIAAGLDTVLPEIVEFWRRLFSSGS